MKKILILTIAFCLTAPHLWAQSNMVYSCDFEDATERSQWVMNPTANPQQKANLTNFWNMGRAGHFAPQGQWGLFVGTSETATQSSYNASKTIENLAYRVLPEMEAGKYTITFNWLANTKGSQEGLYACLVPVGTNTYSGATALSMAWFKANALPMTQDTVMHGTSTWSVATAHFSVAQKTQYKLVFMFFATRGAAVGPAPAVDNIEIFKDVQCSAPTDVTHTIEGMDVNLQWKGSGDSYDVRTYSYETGKWQEMHVPASAAKTQSSLISNVEEGIGIFFLRSHCGDTHSEWVKYEKFIFHKGVRCIDYLDLNKTTCAYGSVSSPGSVKGVVDNGYADKYSRHTLHYVPGEIDPRTVDGNIGLKTKPDDALASVRLGNWNVGSEAEQVTYTYKVVDGDNAILQLRYAVVMEDPAHDATAQPRFTLSISGSRSGKISCAEANFVAGSSLSPADGWHVASGGTSPVNWKDWTTVSINLQDYVGETLKITLTTYDCTQSGHFGYAYFTLDCSSGEMSGLNCGEDNPTTSFTAPEGFNYRWYLDDPSQVLGTNQTFTIGPMDTLTYHVDVINKTNADCYYTLTACGWPRIPVPLADYNVTAEHCQNVVTFANKSYVKVKNQITRIYQRSNEKITSLYWDFGDGTPVVQSLDSVVKHTYPVTGGPFTVRLSAGISKDSCLEVLTLPLNLPDLHIPLTEAKVPVCKADYPFGYEWNQRLFFYPNNIDSTFMLQSVSGCDSLVHLKLTWADKTESIQYDSICEGDTYRLGGQEMSSSGTYFVTLKKANACGCDSVVELHLNVIDHIELTVADTVWACDGDSVLDIPYELTVQNVENVTLSFDVSSQAQGVPAVVQTPTNTGHMLVTLPNHPCQLHAQLTAKANLSCGVPVRDIYIGVRYSASILEQNTALIAVLDSTVNGGYSFINCQWYRDGEKVEGISQYVLRTSNADSGHEFYALLTAPDGTQIATCPIIYSALTPIEKVEWQQMEGSVWVYDVLGREVRHAASVGELGELPHGIYVVKNKDYAIKVVK